MVRADKWYVWVATLAILAAVVPAVRVEAAAGKATELQAALRDLLVGHAVWVRTVVVATRLGDREAARVADRKAVENARAIGQALAPLYGQDAATAFGNLFTGHYRAVKAFLDATLEGNETRRKAAVDRMTKNAGEIAAFLNGANPNLPKDAVLSLLGAHAAHHVAAIDATRRRDWAREAEVWDMMVKHLYKIADALTDGIVKQFPDRF
ncbi:MAG: hypothetical protein QN157_13180 [Armatimonadota bacterium]|nr:hypothetical protein [Armatimonadota bacterium]